ncbi:alpha/beta hydrolase family protein [Saccharospirillum salsuginis]|uniref:Alpha/beta hydrolase n=1 Tax=Saccharospirillum salsuginis TaxID=418750 RepID=A0A918N526_9GAMM|nr:alpha/beta hydrolase family protein [Saccharospirillum salsuginis]GGX40116.1 alpha/beta hydrolase [Saccharospirillum salsuginis]
MTLHRTATNDQLSTRSPETGTRQSRPMPKRYRALGSALNVLGWVSPVSAGRVLNRMWFTPVHGRPGERTRAFWNSADRRIPMHIGPEGLDLHCWGPPTAPVILGVHGWRGSGSQFRQLVGPLVEAGYQVCLFDLPGHGLNPSRSTHLYEFVQVLLAIQDQLGRPAGVIAHSIGCQTVVQALEQGLQPGYLALVSPGLNIEAMVDRFSGFIGLSDRVKRAFKHELTAYSIEIAETWLGEPVAIWDRLNHDFARQVLTPNGLLVADREDEEVDWADFELTAGYWTGAETHFTRGLGHYRVLKDDGVVEKIARFFGERL